MAAVMTVLLCTGGPAHRPTSSAWRQGSQGEEEEEVCPKEEKEEDRSQKELDRPEVQGQSILALDALLCNRFSNCWTWLCIQYMHE